MSQFWGQLHLAAIDSAFCLETDGAEGSEPMAALKLSCFKMRSIGEPRPLHLKLGETCFEVMADPSADRERERLDRLANAIGQSSMGLTARDIDALVKPLSMGRAEVRGLVKRLESEGRVVLEKGRYCLAGNVRIEV